jgi:hypothetical protein
MTQARVGGFLAEGVMSRWLTIALTATEAPRFSTTGSILNQRRRKIGVTSIPVIASPPKASCTPGPPHRRKPS